MNLLFVWIESVDLAVARVSSCVEMGGHHIHEDVIRRRYFRCMQNFLKFYSSLADRWILCDNSTAEPYFIALQYKSSSAPIIYDEQGWLSFNEITMK